MIIQFKTRETNRRIGQINRVYHSHKDLEGSFILELDIVATEISSEEQLNELIGSLGRIKGCFRRPTPIK